MKKRLQNVCKYSKTCQKRMQDLTEKSIFIGNNFSCLEPKIRVFYIFPNPVFEQKISWHVIPLNTGFKNLFSLPKILIDSILAFIKTKNISHPRNV